MKKHIYIYSPSGAVRDKAAFRRGIKCLTSLGHEVEVDVDALSGEQRFAGSDDTRLRSIHRAAASGADVAMLSRGGYGLTRILGAIDYKALHKATQKGTAFVGHSDFTALQLGLLAQTGTVSWAGPHVCGDFGVASSAPGSTLPEVDDIMLDCFGDLLLGQGEGTGWRQAPNKASSTASHHIKNATLWGGNLTVLSSLLGTPYFPSIRGGVLFLEDVGEHPYRIERMLTQLLHAGVLNNQKALVLGQFTEFKLTSHDRGYKLQTVVDWLKAELKIPVVTNLPFGHVPTKVLLPVGAQVDLVLQDRDALLLWGDEV
ncbi:MAG: LD-carboxypeptidase [Burkholderiales bacterium PBB4]|nr:MAG: LD-carboxypeptidase [Burkholderiales bacterium PBB4]